MLEVMILPADKVSTQLLFPVKILKITHKLAEILKKCPKTRFDRQIPDFRFPLLCLLWKFCVSETPQSSSLPELEIQLRESDDVIISQLLHRGSVYI